MLLCASALPCAVAFSCTSSVSVAGKETAVVGGTSPPPSYAYPRCTWLVLLCYLSSAEETLRCSHPHTCASSPAWLWHFYYPFYHYRRYFCNITPSLFVAAVLQRILPRCSAAAQSAQRYRAIRRVALLRNAVFRRGAALPLRHWRCAYHYGARTPRLLICRGGGTTTVAWASAWDAGGVSPFVLRWRNLRFISLSILPSHISISVVQRGMSWLSDGGGVKKIMTIMSSVGAQRRDESICRHQQCQ